MGVLAISRTKSQQRRVSEQMKQESKMIKINRVPDKSLAEIYKTGTLLQMALLEKVNDLEYTQLHCLVTCKDFIGDIYRSSLTKENINFYGMKWDGKSNEPDWKSINLMIKFPKTAMRDSFIDCFELLLAVELANGVPRSILCKTDDDNIFVVLGSSYWLSNIVKLSFYLFFLRLLGSGEIKSKLDWIVNLYKVDTKQPDIKGLKSIPMDTFIKLCADLHLLSFKEWDGLVGTEFTQARTFHHNSGILSVFGTHCEVNYEVVAKNSHYVAAKKAGLATHH
jgi:hypothetical protein